MMATTCIRPPISSNLKGHVWLIDDDQELLEMLHERLSQSGWDTRCFEASETLVKALTQDKPHLLVMDRLMPGLSGIQLLEWLRAQGHHFPVIMLSAMGAGYQRIEGLEKGANDYMAKPFLWRELELRIESLIRDSSAALSLCPPKTIFLINKIRFNPRLLELQGPAGTPHPITRGDSRLLTTFCLSPGITIERELLYVGSGSIVNAHESRSIDTRISKLRQHLNRCKFGSGRIIQSVRGSGYRLNAEVHIEQPT